MQVKTKIELEHRPAVDLSPTMNSAPAQKHIEQYDFIQVPLMKYPYSLSCPSLKAIIISNSPCFKRYSAQSKICPKCPLQQDCKSQSY